MRVPRIIFELQSNKAVVKAYSATTLTVKTIEFLFGKLRRRNNKNKAKILIKKNTTNV